MSKDDKSAHDKSAEMPDIYAETPDAEEPPASTTELTTPEDDDISKGFDPYDTARLYKK